MGLSCKVLPHNFIELIGVAVTSGDDDILLVSRKGQAIRFQATDDQLRPMGRATGGVRGMKFKHDDDSVLSLSVIRAAQVAAEEAAEARLVEDGEAPADIEPGDLPDVKEQYVFTITDGGYAKRTRITDYRITNRGGVGIRAVKLSNEDRGGLVGAFIVEEGDEVLSITSGGQVVRSPIDTNFRATGRDSQGVKFVTPKKGDTVAVVARSVEAPEEDEESPVVADGATIDGQDAPADTTEE